MAEYKAGSVLGLSSLRDNQAPSAPPALTEEARQRQEYLKRYMDGGDTQGEAGRRKKKRKKGSSKGSSALKVVDEDIEWKAAAAEEDILPHHMAAKVASEDEDDGAGPR